MSPKLLLPRVLVVLLGLTLVLLITTAVVLAVGAILRAMGDQLGGLVLEYAALGFGIALAVALICLLLATVVYALDDKHPPDEAA